MDATTTDEREAKARACEAEAARQLQAQAESWDRSDTDGFLTQWACGIGANKARLQAEIERAGGTAEFRGLFRKATGRRIRAKLVDTRWGLRWAVVGPNGHYTAFLPCGANSRKQRILGLEERTERAPAVAYIAGHGTGLSGQAWAAVRRTDGGFPPDAEPFEV